MIDCLPFSHTGEIAFSENSNEVLDDNGHHIPWSSSQDRNVIQR